MKLLKGIKIENIWGIGKDLVWNNIHPDVNILIGVNGSGKSTLLNILWEALGGKSVTKKKYSFTTITLTGEDNTSILTSKSFKKEDISFDYDLISTFDIPNAHISFSTSPLTKELIDTIYTAGKDNRTFFDYRLKASNFPDQANNINNRIQQFYSLINQQFEPTKKKIRVNVKTNKLEFYNGENVIELEELSSGEKQYLLILFKVFLQEEMPTLLLMDEPEISLDIDWQFQLLNVIRELNPNCQVIIATHSPGIFGDGWGDKVVYMEDILAL